MNPQAVFFPNLECPARGQVGQGNIRIHSQQEQRYGCEVCKETFAATKGTIFYRLKTDPTTVILVLTLLAYGCPVQAIVAAFGFDERTVKSWWQKAGMYILGCVYNFCTYHQSLRVPFYLAQGGCRWLPRTPAMAAGLTDHRWSMAELFLFKVPPPRWTPPKRRGRPSKETVRLVEQWCT